MARRREPPEFPDTARWIITYTDLCTLLLTFFVLLVSMSTVDGRREKKVLDSLADTLGPLRGRSQTSGATTGPNARTEHPLRGTGRDTEVERMKELSREYDVAAEQVHKEKDKTVIRIDQKVLFQPGSTELHPKSRSYLSALAGVIVQSDRPIEIQGHTDLTEGVGQPQWPERSWHLSLKRAQAVYHFLIDQGIDARRMSAHGLSYHQPLIDPLTYPRMGERNQRVEIILGQSLTIPSHLLRQRRGVTSYFNYKNFFFNLFPPSESEPPWDDVTETPR